MQHRFRSRILALTLCLVVASTVSAVARSVVVERARTRVGIARVVLTVAPLVLTDEVLVGDYSVRVPLAPYKGDSGTFKIPLTESFSETVLPGKTLHGFATSRKDSRIYEVACTFQESSKVRIEVTTRQRVLSFEAPYTLSN